jgi:hypothetical protein
MMLSGIIWLRQILSLKIYLRQLCFSTPVFQLVRCANDYIARWILCEIRSSCCTMFIHYLCACYTPVCEVHFVRLLNMLPSHTGLMITIPHHPSYFSKLPIGIWLHHIIYIWDNLLFSVGSKARHQNLTESTCNLW